MTRESFKKKKGNNETPLSIVLRENVIHLQVCLCSTLLYKCPDMYIFLVFNCYYEHSCTLVSIILTFYLDYSGPNLDLLCIQ